MSISDASKGNSQVGGSVILEGNSGITSPVIQGIESVLRVDSTQPSDAGISIPVGQGLFIDKRRAELQKAKNE